MYNPNKSSILSIGNDKYAKGNLLLIKNVKTNFVAHGPSFSDATVKLQTIDDIKA